MPTFEPVDFDPFAASAAPPPSPAGQDVGADRPLTIRVPGGQQQAAPPAPQGGPPTASASGPTFEPVDYDPFAPAAPSWLDTAKDVAQSLPTGIEKGAIGMLGLPGTVADAVGNASEYGLQRLAKWSGLAPDQAQPQSYEDIAASNKALSAGSTMLPRADDITQAIEASPAGPMYQPQTTAGRYAETVGEFVPGAGRSIAGLAKYALAPAVASEAAGQATEGTALEPYARAVAPILAGGAGAFIGRPTPAAQVLRDAAGSISQADLAAAQRLMDAARAQGTPLSLAEAVQHVTGGSTTLPALQRAIEQSQAGGPAMARFYADRPSQVRQAGNAAIDRVGTLPVVPLDGSVGPVRPDPAAVGPGVQRAAQGVLDASPEGQAAAQAVTGAGPRVTPEQAGQVIQPALRGVYDQRLGVRSAQANTDYGAARNAGPGVDVTMLDPQSYVAPPATVYRYDPETQAYAPRQTPQSPASPMALAGQDASGYVQADPRQVVAHIDGQLAAAKGPTARALRQVRGMLFANGDALDTSVAGLGNVREQIGTLINKAVRDGDGFTAGQLRGVRDQLDDTLSDVPAYATATQNFRTNSAPLAPFENDPALSSSIERDPYGTRFAMPADRVPGLIDKGGPSSVRAFAGVAPDPARQAYTRHVVGQVLDRSTTGGRIDLDRLDAAMRDGADALRALPEAQQRLQQIADTQRALLPQRNTMLGRLASTREFGEQAAAILDTNPLPGSERQVSEAVRQIAARSPEAAQALVSQRIRQGFSEATQSNMGGPNQAGGAKFAAVIAGNDQQARNLRAAVEALHGPGIWDDFRRTLDVFEAMGRRLAPGSPTEPLRQFNETLGKGGMVGTATAVGLSPAKWLSQAKEIYRGWQQGRNSAELAALLTRPDAAKVLAAIAKQPPGSSAAQGMAALYLLNTSANQGHEPRR